MRRKKANYDFKLQVVLNLETEGLCLCLCACREGHTSLVKELEQDLKEKPGAIVLSVGGGGLLNGVVEGLRRVDWADVPIVAMETLGAHSLNAAMKAGELVTLPEITRYKTLIIKVITSSHIFLTLILFLC